jgi:hypothetical protein
MRIVLNLLLLILITGKNIAGTDVTVFGHDTAYAGKEIIFKKYTEQITNAETEIARCTVTKDGSFSFSFSMKEITLVFAYIGVYKVHLFVEPDRSYEILLPPKDEKVEDDYLNPYFSPIVVYLGTKQYNENELNILIRMFNDSYQPYYSKHILEITNKKNFTELDKGTSHIEKQNDYSSLEKDIAQMEKPFESSQNKFFNDYRRYRYGLLRMLSLQLKSKSLSEEFFKNQPILYNNPAYMELFNRVFDKYFSHFSQTDKGKDLGKYIGEKDLTGMQKSLASDNIPGKGDLLNLVLLKGLYDEFYDDNYSRNYMLAVLDSFIATVKTPQLIEIALSIRDKTTKLLVGFAPPEFRLYDRDSNIVSLENFKEKYVYINFCSCYSYTCLNEFVMLNNMYEKYKDRMEIVTIIIDEDVNVLNSFLSRSNYQWKFLYFGHQSSIIKDYDIRAFPTYYLIDPKGKLVMSPAPSPGEDFEARFFKLLKAQGPAKSELEIDKGL